MAAVPAAGRRYGLGSGDAQLLPAASWSEDRNAN